jgi:hypothetical protein
MCLLTRQVQQLKEDDGFELSRLSRTGNNGAQQRSKVVAQKKTLDINPRSQRVELCRLSRGHMQ